MALKRGRASRKLILKPFPVLYSSQKPLKNPASISQPLQCLQSRLTRNHSLPHRYGVDRLALMARDPHWLYAYWEITATKQEDLNTVYGPDAWSSTRPVLRVYDVTGVDFDGTNAKSYVDIHVDEHADNWHIQVGQPDRSFV